MEAATAMRPERMHLEGHSCMPGMHLRGYDVEVHGPYASSMEQYKHGSLTYLRHRSLHDIQLLDYSNKGESFDY